MTGGFSRTWGWNSSHTTQNPFLHADHILQLRLPRHAKSERASCGRSTCRVRHISRYGRRGVVACLPSLSELSGIPSNSKTRRAGPVPDFVFTYMDLQTMLWSQPTELTWPEKEIELEGESGEERKSRREIRKGTHAELQSRWICPRRLRWCEGAGTIALGSSR